MRAAFVPFRMKESSWGGYVANFVLSVYFTVSQGKAKADRLTVIETL
jgi:hypothetical protein